MNNWNNFHLHR